MDHCLKSSFSLKVQLLLGLLLILACMRASAITPAPIHRASDPGTPPNTLVTGVVKWSEDDVLVEIYQGHHCIARTKSACGLFKIDLAGKVAQDELFTVLVRGQVSWHRRRYGSLRYLPTRCLTNLEDSQNMELEVKRKYSKYLPYWLRKLRSLLQFRRNRFPMYINEI